MSGAFPRQWTGRLWSDGPTVDGRRLARGGTTTVGPVPLVMGDPPEEVGILWNLAELSGVGVAIGETFLPPGTYRVGISLSDVDAEFIDEVVVYRRARLGGVTVLPEDSPVAWPETQIVVHP